MGVEEGPIELIMALLMAVICLAQEALVLVAMVGILFKAAVVVEVLGTKRRMDLVG